MAKNKHIGSSLDDLLQTTHELEEINISATEKLAQIKLSQQIRPLIDEGDNSPNIKNFSMKSIKRKLDNRLCYDENYT